MVITDRVSIVDNRESVVVEVSWINKWPAVKLAVSRTPRANGRMKRLIVSIMIRVGVNRVGVPSGSRCPSDLVGWFRRPESTIASHIGIAIPIFIESCVVGVNVYGRSPNRLIAKSMIISDVRIIDHWWPVLLIGSINCFVNKLIAHSWMVDKRFVNHRLFRVGNMIGGINKARMASGIPRICGLMN